MLKISQKQQILDYMSEGHPITPLEALNMFGCFRLSARVEEMRKDGIEVKTEYEHKHGKKWAKYSLQSN